MTDFKNEQLEERKRVGGWLLLLCFALIIGSPLRTLFNIVTSIKAASELFDLFPGIRNLVYIDSILSIILMALSIRAGIALWKIKPNAVEITKKYLFIFLGYSVISLFLPFTAGLPAEANDMMLPEVAKGAMQSLIFFGIWYWYLSVSKRVAATYSSYPL
ncbi:MAG TPA: DUF2569 family protein [Chitinophagales bacterium]|nr:DUF2569 family protein [Chitinophagales bacterium]